MVLTVAVALSAAAAPGGASSAPSPSGSEDPWTFEVTDAPRGVAMYYDPEVVDVGVPGDLQPPGLNLQESLLRMGHRVRLFDRLDADHLREALRGSSVLVFPFVSGCCGVAAAVDGDARQVVREFVEGGGVLITLADEQLEGAVFGHPVRRHTRDGWTSFPQAQPSDSPFADVTGRQGPTDNGIHSRTAWTESLPPGAVPVYRRIEVEPSGHVDDQTSVYYVRHGAGMTVSFAWSWTLDEPTPLEQSIRTGWDRVLGAAVSAGAPISPAPTPGAVRDLRVDGREAPGRLRVSWRPARTSVLMLAHVLQVRRQGRVVMAEQLGPDVDSVLLERRGLGRGRFLVRVRAVNSAGPGAWAGRSFRVGR